MKFKSEIVRDSIVDIPEVHDRLLVIYEYGTIPFCQNKYLIFVVHFRDFRWNFDASLTAYSWNLAGQHINSVEPCHWGSADHSDRAGSVRSASARMVSHLV